VSEDNIFPAATSGPPAGGGAGGSGGGATGGTGVSDPRSDDAASAVADVLKDLGADRGAIEGSSKPRVIVPAAEPATGAAPAAGEKVKVGDKAKTGAPAEGADDKAGEAGTPAGEKTSATPATPEDNNPLNLTHEDLEVIDKNPLLKKGYKGMVRALNKRFGEHAEVVKAHQADLDTIAKLRSNPIVGIQALAQAAGVKITIGDGGAPAGQPPATPATPAAGQPTGTTPAVNAALAEAKAKFAKSLSPEGAELLFPIIEQAVRAIVGEEITPVKSDLQRVTASNERGEKAAVTSALSTALNDYGRLVEGRGEDWSDEIAGEMAKLVSRIRPTPPREGESPMTLPEYLDILYNTAVAERNRTAAKTRSLERLRGARDAGAEPVRGTRPAAPPSVLDRQITAEMSDAEAARLAIQQVLESQRQ
jgi:hypothetical protein